MPPCAGPGKFLRFEPLAIDRRDRADRCPSRYAAELGAPVFVGLDGLHLAARVHLDRMPLNVVRELTADEPHRDVAGRQDP